MGGKADNRYCVPRQILYNDINVAIDLDEEQKYKPKIKGKVIPKTLSGDFWCFVPLGSIHNSMYRKVTILPGLPKNQGGRHRVLINCHCGKQIPFGRFAQHIPTHGF